MRVPFIFGLLFFYSISGIAQSFESGMLEVHVVPLVFFEKNPRLQVGAEFHPEGRIWYGLDIGFGNNKLSHASLQNSQWGQNYSFFEIMPEIRLDRIEGGWITPYFAFNPFYLRMRDNLNQDYFYPDDNSNQVSYKTASFEKEKIGAYLKAGSEILVFKRLVIDLFVGAGMAYRNIQYNNVTEPNQISIIEEWFSQPYRHQGESFLPQAELGIKIGYVILGN